MSKSMRSSLQPKKKKNLKISVTEANKERNEKFNVTESGTFHTGELSIGRDGVKLDESFKSIRSRNSSQQELSRLGSCECGTDSEINSTQNPSKRLKLEDLEEIEHLGNGVSGDVKKVKHKHTQEIFAVKSIRINLSDEAVGKNIVNELKTLHGSSHPNIVQCYQSYFELYMISIVMEFVDGGSLAGIMRAGSGKQNQIPEKYLAQLTKQVLDGLKYLHQELRTIHRDIKPQNLLLSSSGVLKIADFGVSTLLGDRGNSVESWVGTVTYMSPERLNGERYSFNSDIWSLGVILYECATGTYPFAKPGTPVQFWTILSQLVNGQSPKLPENQFSRDFVEFVDLCMRKGRKERPEVDELMKHPFVTKRQKGVNLANLLREVKQGEKSQKQ
eukprot:TRINITY_DN7071_c0_g2_i2.p1 TRINITY_DN7071_c0_g2~~TRINITY_DN7071_c0_g2_i2.p1  ORF type:complete len:388 (-),score=45.59 TRINITY_DN7071_c0_g2_i2:1205-2368(-)